MQHDATLFKRMMTGEHCPQGFTNRDIRARLASTQAGASTSSTRKTRAHEAGIDFAA